MRTFTSRSVASALLSSAAIQLAILCLTEPGAAGANVPRITSVAPMAANPGSTIKISGENFSSVLADNTVYFGGVRATVTAATANELQVSAPSGASFARVTVTVNSLTATAPQPFLPTFTGDGSNISTGTFAAGFNLPAGDGPDAVLLVDVDNDGRPDLVVGNGYGHTIRVYQNIHTNGALSAASFAAPVDFVSPGAPLSNPYKLTAADLDGDGKLDLIASGVDVDKVAIWRNTSTAGTISSTSFAEPFLLQTGPDSRFARAADLDGDGRPDIISANYSASTISIIRNIGASTFGPESFAPRIDLETGSGPYELDIGDLDGDSRPDIAVVNMGSSISLFRNVAPSGVLDTNSFEIRVELAASVDGDAIVIGDVDGDGKPDLVTGTVHPLKISVFRNLATSGALTTNSFAARVDFSTGNWVHNVGLADLNGDGKPDIAVTGELPSYLSVFQNVSTPGEFTANSLSTPTGFASGWNVWGLGIADLDADGRPDMVFGNAYNDTITLYRNISPLAGPPIIISQPTDQVRAVGESATFAVEAAGSADLAYQWWKDAVPVAGATGQSLAILNAQFTDAGNYLVVVTNSYGAATSAVAVLTVTNLAPYVAVQPQDRKVPLNGTVTFTVTAGGNRPLSYQWRFNSTDLPGAINSALTLTNVQLKDAGAYSVEVSNSVGSILSSNATLTVFTPPAVVLIPNTNTLSGWPVTVPVLLVANGNENAVSFSLSVGTPTRGSLLQYLGAAVGPGAPGASLVLNTNLLSTGLLGIAVALPADATFAPGTQVVATVTFATSVLTYQQTVSQPLVFLDNPIPRQITDSRANSLPTTFASGTVVLLPTDVEGDVSPRPGGNRSVTLNDWVQAGRFAAGLDTPAPGGEFQRADCAPRETRGDGQIKVTDWVQTGRYFGKLDSLSAAGGPTNVVTGKTASVDKPSDGPGTRSVQVSTALAVQGVPVEVPLLLEAEGNENALGFSLAYDPSRLEYRGAVAGKDAVGAVLNLNATQSGRLGVALALPTGAMLQAGTRELARVTFMPASATNTDTVVGFVDAPVLRAVSDAAASELLSDYVSGTIQLRLPPSLQITLSGGEAVLAWPAWAGDFHLQFSAGDPSTPAAWTNLTALPSTNGSQLMLKVPLSADAQFFRLQRP